MSRLRSYIDTYRYFLTLNIKKSKSIQLTVNLICEIWNASSVQCYSILSISKKNN